MTLELAPDVLAAIEAAAARTGKTPDELVGEALRGWFIPRSPGQRSHEEFLHSLESIGRPRSVVLTEEQMSRESIYE